MVIDSGVTVMSREFWKWVGKITHLVLKMGRECYMFGLTVSTLRAALWLNYAWKKRKKNLWDQESNQGTSGDWKLHILVRKWIAYKLCSWDRILQWYMLRIKNVAMLMGGCVLNTKIFDKKWRKSSKRSRNNNEMKITKTLLHEWTRWHKQYTLLSS